MSDLDFPSRAPVLLAETSPVKKTADPRQERLEALYSSDGPEGVLAFYAGLRDVHELVAFSSNRPRPESRVYGFRIQNDPSLAIVAPTRNLASPLAKNLVSAYREFPVIIVESRGQYFNFAYAMNLGIQAAIDLHPERILVTNDDAFPTEDARTKLTSLDRYGPGVLAPDVRSSGPNIVGRRLSIREQPPGLRTAYRLLGAGRATLLPVSSRAQAWASRLFAGSSGDLARYFLLSNDEVSRGLVRSFVEWLLQSVSREALQVMNVQPVAIFPTRVIEAHSFDEVFINGGEDLDLAVQLKLAGIDCQELPLQFRTEGGASLGTGVLRVLRHSVFEALYFGYKLRSVYHLM